MIFFKCILFSLFYGVLEAQIYKRGFTGDKSFFGTFHTYHIILFFLYTVVSYPELYNIPLMVLIEDISFYFASPKELKPDSWISKLMGSFKLFGQTIPVVYIFLIVVYIILRVI